MRQMQSKQHAPEISFGRFPFWQGVRQQPGGQRYYPFRLGINERGFICQQSNPDVQRQIVEAYKSPDYSMPTKPPGSSPWANRRGEWHRSFINKHVSPLKGKSVMEIGAGGYYLADRLTKEDQAGQYIIIDPSVKKTGHHPRVRLISDYFDDKLDLDGENPDVIISITCLEHVSDPFGFLTKMRGLLKSGESRAVLIFPDIETQFRMGDFNALCFEHLNYFSETSATSLMEQAGLEVIACEKSLDTLYYVLRKGEEPSSPRGDADAELFAAAAAKFRDGLDSIAARIKDARRQGRKVACHGACNGLNTLFAITDIAGDAIRIFDGDDTKAGMYLPACPVPILPATSLLYREADLIVVAAMTFYAEIRSFLESFHGIPSDRILPMCSLPEKAAVSR